MRFNPTGEAIDALMEWQEAMIKRMENESKGQGNTPSDEVISSLRHKYFRVAYIDTHEGEVREQ